MTSAPVSSRRNRRTLIAIGVLVFVILVLVTISPLRSYVTGAATRDRGTDETSYVIAAAGDIVCSSRMQREVQERAERRKRSCARASNRQLELGTKVLHTAQIAASCADVGQEGSLLDGFALTASRTARPATAASLPGAESQ